MGREQEGYSIHKAIGTEWKKHVGFTKHRHLEKVKGFDSWHYEVYNRKDELLGHIAYDRGWKCFVWVQFDEVVMSIDCLQEVLNFMKNDARRDESEEKRK
jgi:hypothetical protein